jgi:hypothetical protein
MIMIQALAAKALRQTASRTVEEPDGEIVYRLASRLDEVESALALVYSAYRRRGLIRSNPSRMRITPYHLLPETEILIATQANQVLCTATLIYDNAELGLPIESTYGDEVAERRTPGKRFVEVSCLADNGEGKTPLKVLVRLMALIAQCTYDRGVSDLLVTVHPHHADFYTKFWGFDCFAGVRRCEAVRNNPAVALSLDLIWLKETSSRCHQRAFEPPFAEDVLRTLPVSQEIRDQLSVHLYSEALFCGDSGYRAGASQVPVFG